MIQVETQKTFKGKIDQLQDLAIDRWLKDHDADHNIITFYQEEGDSSTISGRLELIEAFSKYLKSLGYMEKI